ncbi:MAG: MBL fold metallo-hydrolase [Kiritimatiellaeota bacterium]|nr:MBL fold metallo-hydrolase [Kiritimatiellota bacterium]
MATKITILVDNTASGKLVGEHGLSSLIEKDETMILFDAGQGEAFAYNIDALGVDLAELAHIVFSHGHYDHTGGIARLAETAELAAVVHMHPAALDAKFAREPDGTAKSIGISKSNREWLLSRGDDLHLSKHPVEIAPGVLTTGEIPEIFSQESCSTRFRLDKELTQIDDMADDMSLFMRTDAGTVVVLGCCHRGLANTLAHITMIAETDEIAAVIGGTHLRNADRARLDFTVETVKKHHVKRFVATHCTGIKSAEYLKEKLPDVFTAGFAGMTMEFD